MSEETKGAGESPLFATLKAQRDGYARELQLTLANAQRLQGAMAALDRVIGEAGAGGVEESV